MTSQKHLDDAGWVCSHCGKKFGTRIPELATFHEDPCDVCGRWDYVTQPRDYGVLLTKQNKKKYIPITRRELFESLYIKKDIDLS